MRKAALLALFLCVTSSSAGLADSNTENWCGTYFEDNGRGFIRLAREDFGTGSSNCSPEDYYERVENSGAADIALDFTHNRSSINHWRKFNNHLIEVRGKFRNGYIDNTRFVRDMGV
ncbi:MAG: hypothetical protein NC218_06280 [Acetobacter sp.]|nr:hypothetical protein [Acetobacter sp.]